MSASISPSAAATHGMPVAPPPMSAAPPQNPIVSKLQPLILGARQIIQLIRAMPGADQAKLEQGVMQLNQALHMIADAVPKPGAAPDTPPSHTPPMPMIGHAAPSLPPTPPAPMPPE